MARKVSVSYEGFEVNPDIVGEGFTQSEMQTWDNCPERWYLGYNHMLYKQGGFAWALTYGTWMHGALEQFYHSKGKRWSLDCVIPNRKFVSHEHLAKEEYWQGVADIQMQMYAAYFKRDHEIWKPVAIEEIVDLTFEGIRLKGMIDVYAQFLPAKKKQEFFVWDHKSTYRIDKTVVMGWDFRFQFMFYCWLATKIKKWAKMPCRGFVVNAIKKPQIKWNPDKEPLPAFLQRLQIDMQENPEKYYYREKLLLKPGDLDHFEKNILRPKLQRIRMLLDPKTPQAIKELLLRNKNTDHCISKFGSACEFMPACQHGLAIEGHQYRRREVKHRELITEETE